ncbi:MAG TPA: hypothetical protein DET46_08090 [Comamonadaceae bacterium]|nr:hypothetical protein [Comamonadaceae bacterium]
MRICGLPIEERAREWLAKPNAQLGGASPENAALIPAGLNTVMVILQIARQATSDEFDPDHPGSPPRPIRSLNLAFNFSLSNPSVRSSFLEGAWGQPVP